MELFIEFTESLGMNGAYGIALLLVGIFFVGGGLQAEKNKKIVTVTGTGSENRPAYNVVEQKIENLSTGKELVGKQAVSVANIFVWLGIVMSIASLYFFVMAAMQVVSPKDTNSDFIENTFDTYMNE